MENISYVGLSHQMALQQQMDLVSNNIANMTTPGYKSQEMLFLEYLVEPEDGENLSQVLDQSSYRRTEQGTFKQTFNPLDLAISGDGYFAVETRQGVRYTRAGNFALNNEGTIVNTKGHALLDQNGQPLKVPEGDTQITITADGSLSSESGEIGKIKLVTFENPQDMSELGNGLYDMIEAEEIPDDESQVIQGAIESSNVQPIAEMTKMIEILRTYQSVARIMQNDHDRQRSAIRTLTNTNA